MKDSSAGQADNDIVIEVKDVYKSFRNVDAVRGVDLKIRRGEFVALLGPNGAGKTTLVEMIEGIQKPDKGEIYIMGKKWKGHEDELHRILGISLQETRFVDKLTVRETLDLFAVFYSLGRDRVDEVIRMIDLEDKRDDFTGNLSGGQRQKLALGISLLNVPKILLLDEPTTGLDPNARREIWSILLKLRETSQTSLILTTHYMDEAERLCDYIIIIDKGKILNEGTLSDLTQKEGGNLMEFTLEESNGRWHEFLKNNKRFDIDWLDSGSKGYITFKEPESELPEFFNYLRENNLSLKNFEIRRKTLDDLFTSLTGRHLNE
jgi:ABC-2 type transport system ATP-binding protein